MYFLRADDNEHKTDTGRWFFMSFMNFLLRCFPRFWKKFPSVMLYKSSRYSSEEIDIFYQQLKLLNGRFLSCHKSSSGNKTSDKHISASKRESAIIHVLEVKMVECMLFFFFT